jgi:hypothetical protein
MYHVTFKNGAMTKILTGKVLKIKTSLKVIIKINE